MRLFGLPHRWRWVSLGDIAAPIPNAIVDGPFGSNLKVSDYIDKGVPVLQGKNISDDTFQWFDVRYISERKAETLKRSSVRIGDILIVKIGSIGFSAVVSDLMGHEYAIIPANLAKMTPSTDVVDIAYLRHWLINPLSKDYLIGAASRTAQPALSLTKIKELPVPLPPLPEQRRIAAILDQADGLRAKRRQSLAQLDTLTQSLFLDLFGNPLENPKGWAMRSLRDLILGKPNNGVFRKNEDYGQGVPVVWVEELFRGISLDTSQSRQLHATMDDVVKYGLRYGDILFCRSSLKLEGVGFNNVYLGPDGKALFECHIIRISPNPRLVDPTFLNFALRLPSQRTKLFKQAKTVTMSTIDQDGLLRIDIPIPPLLLQQHFASQVSAIERLRAVQRPSVTKLDELFASLQHRAFRGEL